MWKNTLLVFFVLFVTSRVFAATPTPAISLMPIAGVNCGDANNTDSAIKKCCKTPIMTPELVNQEFKKNIWPIFWPILFDNGVVDSFNQKAGGLLFTGSQITTQPCSAGAPSTPGDTNNDACICIIEPTKAPLSAMKPFCDRINSGSGEVANCNACADAGGMWTSLGCFSGNISEFIGQKILGTGIGIAGGITLLCIMFAAFQMQTSGGSAEKIKKAQELLTNCITGLMVIIFSVLILKIIGVDILRLPSFR